MANIEFAAPRSRDQNNQTVMLCQMLSRTLVLITILQMYGINLLFEGIFFPGKKTSPSIHPSVDPSVHHRVGHAAQAQALRVGARRLAEAPPRMLRPKDPFRCRQGFRKKMWKKNQLKPVVNQHRDCWNITIESLGKYRHLHFGEHFPAGYVSLLEWYPRRNLGGGIWDG